jgi:hypothetical protein
LNQSNSLHTHRKKFSLVRKRCCRTNGRRDKDPPFLILITKLDTYSQNYHKAIPHLHLLWSVYINERTLTQEHKRQATTY